MKRVLTPRQQKASNVRLSAYFIGQILLFCAVVALMFCAARYIRIPLYLVQSNPPLWLSLTLANIYAFYKADRSIFSQKANYKHFISRFATEITQPSQQFVLPSPIRKVLSYGGGLSLCCGLAYVAWILPHSPQNGPPIGKYIMPVSCGLIIVGILMDFPQTLLLRFTSSGIETRSIFFFWKRLDWSKIAGCEIIQKRNYLGEIYAYTLLFKDEKGAIRFKTSLPRFLSPDEQKRFLETLVNFLQPRTDSSEVNSLPAELEPFVQPPQ